MASKTLVICHIYAFVQSIQIVYGGSITFTLMYYLKIEAGVNMSSVVLILIIRAQTFCSISINILVLIYW